MGVELKLARGGEELFGHARANRPRKLSPPLKDSPPLGILFHFFLFISLGCPNLQGGGASLPEKLSKGNFPLPPQFYAYAFNH